MPYKRVKLNVLKEVGRQSIPLRSSEKWTWILAKSRDWNEEPVVDASRKERNVRRGTLCGESEGARSHPLISVRALRR